MNTLQTEVSNYANEHFPSNVRRGKTDLTRGTEMVTATNGTTKKKIERLTLEQKDEIIRLLKDGYNGVQIAEKTGIPYHNVSYHATKMKKRSGIKRTATAKGGERKGMTDAQKEKIIEMHLKGYSMTEIAEKIGVHYSTPGQYLKRLKEKNMYSKALRKAHKRMGTAPAKKEAAIATNDEVVAKYKKSATTNTLVKELVDEIRAELKSEILKELLGK